MKTKPKWPNKLTENKQLVFGSQKFNQGYNAAIDACIQAFNDWKDKKSPQDTGCCNSTVCSCGKIR